MWSYRRAAALLSNVHPLFAMQKLLAEAKSMRDKPMLGGGEGKKSSRENAPSPQENPWSPESKIYYTTPI